MFHKNVIVETRNFSRLFSCFMWQEQSPRGELYELPLTYPNRQFFSLSSWMHGKVSCRNKETFCRGGYTRGAHGRGTYGSLGLAELLSSWGPETRQHGQSWVAELMAIEWGWSTKRLLSRWRLMHSQAASSSSPPPSPHKFPNCERQHGICATHTLLGSCSCLVLHSPFRHTPGRSSYPIRTKTGFAQALNQSPSSRLQKYCGCSVGR